MSEETSGKRKVLIKEMCTTKEYRLYDLKCNFNIVLWGRMDTVNIYNIPYVLIVFLTIIKALLEFFKHFWFTTELDDK